MSKPLQAVALVALAAIGGAGCGRDGDGQSTADADRFGAVYLALCDSETALAESDVARAGALFADRAHQPLHELAAEVGIDDRSAAARLLEAKQVVEAGFGTPSGPEIGGVARLRATVQTAVDSLGDSSTLSCNEGEKP